MRKRWRRDGLNSPAMSEAKVSLVWRQYHRLDQRRSDAEAAMTSDGQAVNSGETPAAGGGSATLDGYHLMLDIDGDFAVFTLDAGGHIKTWTQRQSGSPATTSPRSSASRCRPSICPNRMGYRSRTTSCPPRHRRGRHALKGGTFVRTALDSGPTWSSAPSATVRVTWRGLRILSQQGGVVKQRRYLWYCLRRQRIELLGCRPCGAVATHHLPFLIMYMTSMPLNKMRAQRKFLNPSIGRMRRLIARWSRSTTLFRHLA